MKITKFSKSVNETLDVTKLYDVEEAFSMMMSFKRKSFNESVDVAFNLGVDPRHAEENIRLSINLPHGIGRMHGMASKPFPLIHQHSKQKL